MLPQYPSVQLVTVAYGDDLSDKSYREAVGLLKSYPDLKVIVSPSSVGIVAAAQAVKDRAKSAKCMSPGWGCRRKWPARSSPAPAKASPSGTRLTGYAATYLADDLVKGTATKTEASMGKLGKVKLDAEGMARWPSRLSTMRATSISSRKFSNPCSSPRPSPGGRGERLALCAMRPADAGPFPRPCGEG